MSKVDLRADGAVSGVDPASYAVARMVYAPDDQATLDEIEAAVAERLAAKPKRLAHTRSVATTAEAMAVRYGVDPWEARVAGLLHDWDKVLTEGEQIEKAESQGIDLGVPLDLVTPLLHGMTAATELAARYPALPSSVFQAVARHTIGAANMTPLDMVVFTADIIEPRRPAAPAVEHARAMVAEGAALDDVYWSAFARGIIYVIETGRYLYPGTLETYNELALRHSRKKHRNRREKHARNPA